MSLPEARRNEELVSLADSQILRWIDELNDVTYADDIAVGIRSEIYKLRKGENVAKNRHKVERLYAELDKVQFKPDYLCVVMDSERDYMRAARGFSINGIKYRRLLGTNGGIKNSTIVFVSERLWPELARRIENGRDQTKEMVPAKLEAYKALTCSASTPVSMPHGVLVVTDCETQFIADTIYIDDELDGEPTMETRPGSLVDLNESDGYGLMLPSLADRWAEEVQLGYRPSGLNTRFAWEKGMVFCFDFLEFAEKVAGNYIVKDAWGTERDIRDVELILTTSMVKLWDSYESCEAYLQNSIDNGYYFGIAKACPEELEHEHNTNYQFIQSYNLSNEEVDELIKPTIDEIRDILSGDPYKAILYLMGTNLSEDNIDLNKAGFAAALMIEPGMINDPYLQSRVYQLIKNRINEAKVGVIKVHGNYSIVSGDPYSLCQHIFGLEVTGILKAGEIYNEYWADTDAEYLACYRAPMTCHNNIRKVCPNRSEEARHWYQYMKTCTALNSWDTAAHALNGCDKDGDLVMLTDNRVLVEKLRTEPALMCVQRKAQKKIVTEEDFIRSNIDSFGDDIGKTTNRITSMFEVQAHYSPDSEEYKILDYRIKCGQLFQQNAIDKAKGIVAKPMPRTWFDRHHAAEIKDEATRNLYISILADRKPYFMRYIYPDLMRQYKKYKKTIEKKALREFGVTADELLAKDALDLTDAESEFVKYCTMLNPVGEGDCVINRICRRFEEEFDGCVGRQSAISEFDYTILKSGVEYKRSQSDAVAKLYKDYIRRMREQSVAQDCVRMDKEKAAAITSSARQEFRRKCDIVCSNSKMLTDIILDLCYKSNATKSFAWRLCRFDMLENLLVNRGNVIRFPVRDEVGDIVFGGERFSLTEKEIEDLVEYCFE